MRAGSLRNHVEIHRRTVTSGANGEAIEAFEYVADASADITALAGNETYTSGQVIETQGFRIRLRWSPTVSELSPADRLVMGTRVFDIKFVQNSRERNAELVVGAQEVLPNVQQQAL